MLIERKQLTTTLAGGGGWGAAAESHGCEVVVREGALRPIGQAMKWGKVPIPPAGS